MTLPFATTSVTIIRTRETTTARTGFDPNPPTQTVVATNVPAVISNPSASTQLVGGTRVVYNATLTVAPTTTLQVLDTVIDQSRGVTWKVLNITKHSALGVPHLLAQIRYTTGAT